MTQEAQSYHCLNVALAANYEALKKLKEKYSSWAAAWSAEKSGYPKINLESEWKKLESENIRLILAEENNYPALLKEIPWQPLGIYLKGEIPSQPGIAIVGTRRATPNGKKLAKKLAQELSRQGAVIISGLAMGIDEASHEGAVEAESPTVAVLATGLNRIYPAQNIGLSEKILKYNGALVSEYPPDSPSYPSNFVHRNRIISGLSRGIVVIEAPEKSGALITARFALEQNREVMAVPGPAEHPNYVGSHRLIRDGAKLVTSAQEILEELNLQPNSLPLPSQQSQNITEEEKLILAAIRDLGWPAPIDKISQMTDIEVSKINQIIAYLIIKGILKE